MCVCVRICAWQVAMGVKWPIDWGYSSECHLCRCYLVERQSYKTRHDNGGELFEGQSTSDTLSYGNCVCNHVIIWCHTFATKLSTTDVPLCLIQLRECFIILIEIISLHIVKATCPHGKIMVHTAWPHRVFQSLRLEWIQPSLVYTRRSTMLQSLLQWEAASLGFLVFSGPMLRLRGNRLCGQYILSFNFWKFHL